MILPLRASAIAGAIPFVSVKTESRLIERTLRHSSSVVLKVFDIFSLITPCASTKTFGVGNSELIR